MPFHPLQSKSSFHSSRVFCRLEPARPLHRKDIAPWLNVADSHFLSMSEHIFWDVFPVDSIQMNSWRMIPELASDWQSITKPACLSVSSWRSPDFEPLQSVRQFRATSTPHLYSRASPREAS